MTAHSPQVGPEGAAPSADEVADAVIRLLVDPSQRASLRTGALRYAATHGYDTVAAELLEALS